VKIKNFKRLLPSFAVMSLVVACGQIEANSNVNSTPAATNTESTSAVTTAATSTESSTDSTAEKNNKVAEEMFGNAWNKGDLTVVDKLIAPDAYDHSPLASEKGSQGFKKIITSFRASMPDLKMTIEDEVFAKDRVVHRWKVEGKHTGAPLFGIPASGKNIALTGITIVKVNDGKIVERWTQLDQFGLLKQLGIIPPPPKSGSK
jgi:steroid delta-isomerase-like uncharacterized protein